jgi:hypothetical protein
MACKSTATLLWSKNGLLILQNQEYLNNFDQNNLVTIAHLKDSYFSSCVLTSRKEYAFDLDITKYAKTLKSLKNNIKRLQFHIKDPQDS